METEKTLQPLTETEVVELVDTICRAGDEPERKTAALLSLICEIDESYRIGISVNNKHLEVDDIADIVKRHAFGRTAAAREAETVFFANLRVGDRVDVR